MRDSSTRFKPREFAFMGGVALGTHCGKICSATGKRLDRHRKEPPAVHAPGGLRLLPQLVGSCDPGGEVGGWGPPGLAY
jgi:hypothetical protein